MPPRKKKSANTQLVIPTDEVIKSEKLKVTDGVGKDHGLIKTFPIYISNLSLSTTTDELKAICGKYGNFLNVKIRIGKMGTLNGICSYFTQSAQNKAVNLLDNKLIAGNSIDVQLPIHSQVNVRDTLLSNEYFCVTISNLPISITIDDLISICGSYRSLYTVRIVSKHTLNVYAICIFTAEWCRNQAIKDLNQTLIGSHRVLVTISNGVPKLKTNLSYIGNSYPNTTSMESMATFGKYKNFADVRSITIQENGRYRYVICTFTKQSYRDQAIKDETIIAGKHVNLKITTTMGRKKLSTKPELKKTGKFDNVCVDVCNDSDDDQSSRKWNRENLFPVVVNNLPLFTTSSDFEKFLSRYGKVKFVKIIPREKASKNSGSKAYGYFTLLKSQTNAIKQLDQAIIEGRRVTVKTPGDKRFRVGNHQF